jgi:Tfp pilus assembly protein PilN
MSPEQAAQLAELMREARPTRPGGVVTAALQVDGDAVELVAYWRDREALEAYLATAEVPRGVELMRKVGVEPEWHVVDVLELG